MLQGRIKFVQREKLLTLEPILCKVLDEILAAVSSSVGTLLSEGGCADGFIAICYLRKPCVPFVHKNLIGTGFIQTLSFLRQRQGSRAGENKERGEIILSKDALGCTVFHLCLSSIRLFNSCLGLNAN